MFWDRLNTGLKNAAEHMKALPQRSLPTTVNDRWFQVHTVPMNHEGDPVPEFECTYLEYQVWDSEALCLFSTRRLREAIQKAEDLNWEMINGPIKQTKQSKGLRGYQKGAVLDSPVAGDSGGGPGDAGGSPEVWPS